MTDARILQIIREEIAYENNLIFEGVNSYTPINGYRNNQLIEVYDNKGKQLINEGMIDTVQSVLDYAGFIPGIGDLLDGINALIYMIRKKYFLGVTSLVATIPVAFPTGDFFNSSSFRIASSFLAKASASFLCLSASSLSIRSFLSFSALKAEIIKIIKIKFIIIGLAKFNINPILSSGYLVLNSKKFSYS